MQRLRIHIEREPIDKVLDLIALVVLLILIGLPLFFYNQLPDTIPKHFGANGQPDGFGGKGYIWVLPVLGVIFYIGGRWLVKYPHTFNYPQKVTKENAKGLYTLATRLLRALNAICICIFSGLTYATIQIALGYKSSLSSWFIPLMLTFIFGTTGYFLYKSIKA